MAPGRRPGPSGVEPDEARQRSAPRVHRAGPSGVELRLPTLEVFAAMRGDLLSAQGRPLTETEIKLALPIFGASLRYEKVRVVVAAFANSPTTLGNFVRVAKSGGIHTKQLSDATLIHELTHVWQFQTRGMRYMSNSLCHQLAGMLSGGSRNEAYRLQRSDVLRAGSIDKLPAEKQATLVEFWFDDRYFFEEEEEGDRGTPPVRVRDEPAAESMLEEVRQARPLPENYILEEAAFGAGAGARRRADPASADPAAIPWLRIAF
jgi:hypothetical protein